MTIPASQLVSVNPSVLSAGGNPLALNGLILSKHADLPVGPPVGFFSALAVANYFGAESLEAQMAATYFDGYVGATQLPNQLLFSRYADVALAGFLRGATNTATLTQIQAITAGSMGVIVDGDFYGSLAVDLSTSTSLADACNVLMTELGLGGIATITYNTTLNAFVVTSDTTGATSTVALPAVKGNGTGTATFATNVMTVASVVSGTFEVGQYVGSAGVNPNTKILAQLTGTPGGTGTYQLSTTPGTITPAQNVTAYGSGTVADLLNLDAGATSSPGIAATAPAAALNAIIQSTQNWVAFATTFEPGATDKEAFALWASQSNTRFLYACWDTDITGTQNPSSYTGIGKYLASNNLSGTAVVWYDPLLAAFVLGCIAAIDFNRRNARITLAFKSSASVLTQVTDETSAQNLLANGYNFYGSYATANDQFIQFQNGQVSGPFGFIDSYINAIWFTNQCQLALMSLLASVPSIPYNPSGYGMIKAALQDPVNQALNFGAMRAGVTLSSSQAAQVNSAAGVQISDVLNTRGWYVQVLDPGAQVRAQRGTPVCTIWYMDGQAVQKITLASIDIL